MLHFFCLKPLLLLTYRHLLVFKTLYLSFLILYLFFISYIYFTNIFNPFLTRTFFDIVLTPFRMGLFGDAYRFRGAKRPLPPLPRICQTYPRMLKLGTVVSYLKKIEKYINHLAHRMSSADISISSLEINNFCYIMKYKYRLHLNT